MKHLHTLFNSDSLSNPFGTYWSHNYHVFPDWGSWSLTINQPYRYYGGHYRDTSGDYTLWSVCINRII